MIYFTSDLHLGHSNIISYERSDKFSSVEEHDSFVVDLLNKLSPTDTLYLLGDIGFGLNAEKLKGLKCHTILIMGNHDKKSKTWYNNIFDEVYDHPVWLEKRILLSHEPQVVESDVLNLHGHLHGAYLDMDNYWNMNIHMCDYKLVSLKQVYSKISKIKVNKEKYKFMNEWWIEHQVCTIKGNNILTEDGHINIEENKKRIQELEKKGLKDFETD